MQKALHVRTTVQPGGKVEFANPELEAGQTVDVVVLHDSGVKGRSIMEMSTAYRSAACIKPPRKCIGDNKEEPPCLSLAGNLEVL